MRQHIKAKHPNERIPSIKEMQTAAAKYNGIISKKIEVDIDQKEDDNCASKAHKKVVHDSIKIIFNNYC